MKTQTIQVQGKGRILQAPDLLRILFMISHTEKDFMESVEGCNKRTDAVRQAIAEVGREESELKTTDFSIREVTDYVKGRNIHLGYMATHQTTFDLPIDKPLIGRLLSAVVQGEGKPNVQLIFTVEDPESLRQRVLADAMANAKRRAETISEAAHLKLGKIERIEYGYTEVRVSSNQYSLACESSGFALAKMAPNFEPDAIVAEDTVTVHWVLQK